MKLTEINDSKSIAFLILVSYLARIILSPFHVMFPFIPHDLYANIGPGKCMAEGKYFEWGCLEWRGFEGEMSAYGPFWSVLMMFWYLLFGEFNFFMFKIPSIIFDTLTVLMIYFIGKKLFDKKLAFYLGLLYSLSFFALHNSAVLGDDSAVAMFFVFGSLYFLIDKKLPISAVFTSVALMFRVEIGFVSLLPIFYYVYRKYGLNVTFKHVLLFGILYLLFLSPFIINAGIEKTLYYVLGSPHTVGQKGQFMSFYNIFKYVTNVNVNFLLYPILLSSCLITFLLFFIRKMTNHEIELFRNIILFWTAILLFGGMLSGNYLYFIFSFSVVLFGSNFQRKNLIAKQWMLGVVLIFTSLLIYSTIYRWGIIQYSDIDRSILLLVTITSPLGVFLFLKGVKMNYRIIWTIITLGVIMWETQHAAPLLALPIENIANQFNQYININRFTVVEKLYGDHIRGKPEVFLAYGIFYGVPAVIMWVCLSLLYYYLLKEKQATSKDGYFRSKTDA